MTREAAIEHLRKFFAIKDDAERTVILYLARTKGYYISTEYGAVARYRDGEYTIGRTGDVF